MGEPCLRGSLHFVLGVTESHLTREGRVVSELHLPSAMGVMCMPLFSTFMGAGQTV